MSYFQNKVIWITGASSGIGEALAQAFARQGAKLILSSRRENELERVRNECGPNSEIRVLPMDLSEPGSFKAKTDQAIAAFGHIDIMVHNAGIGQRALVLETNMEMQRKLMELDYFSQIELTYQLLPHFIERRSGQFVVMSSVMGKLGTPMRSAYAAAKHALHGFFDCLRAEMGKQNIRVTILTPGYIRTNISVNALKADGTPLGVMGKNIENGLSPQIASRQILKAISAQKFESYIGKFGPEKIALWLNRFIPGLVIRQAARFSPK
jgi:dehydrogenase/reductase SDR family member 7B